MARILTHHGYAQTLIRLTDVVQVVTTGELTVILEDQMLTAQIEQEELEVVLEECSAIAVVEQDELVIVITQPELEC